MKEYIIPFFGLKIGTHQYDFDIGQSFFEAFESNLIENAQFKVQLSLEKSTNLLLLDLKAKGTVADFCDRCGDPIRLNVKAKEHIIVKFGDESYEQTDEIIILSHDSYELDVSHVIYEMLVLGMPQKKVHQNKKECNQEVISRLQNSEEGEKTDPRWDALKKLK